jgi:hypothetical protein
MNPPSQILTGLVSFDGELSEKTIFISNFGLERSLNGDPKW